MVSSLQQSQTKEVLERELRSLGQRDHLVSMVSSLQQSQTKEILERELRSFIQQVRSEGSSI